MAGPWEVEQKFHVTDIEMLLERLADLKATEVRTELHVDTYLAHPCRDFRASDEAFRIRHSTPRPASLIRVNDYRCRKDAARDRISNSAR